jgi:transketolase
VKEKIMSEAPEDTSADMRLCANAIRALAMDAVEKAKSGHPGMPMGMADVATVLFRRFMKIDASRPDWPDRDRFVLSAGHGSMLLYALHYLLGYPGMSRADLENFRQSAWRSPSASPPRVSATILSITTLMSSPATAV